MPITQEMIEARRQWIGASDVPAILGISRFATPLDVWAQKTGRIIEPPSSEAMDAGNRIEPVVVDYAEERLGLGPLSRNRHMSASGFGFPMASNLDALVVSTGDPVEAKTAGLFGPIQDQWGEEGTDQIPDAYLVQCNVHLLVTDRDVCHVPAFLGGRGFAMFQVSPSKPLMDVILERCAAFWACVEEDRQPEGRYSIEIAKSIRRATGKTISIPEEIGQRYITAKAQEKASKDAAEEAQAVLLTAMADAEIGECETGVIVASRIKRAAYTVQAGEYTRITIKAKGKNDSISDKG
ncbi:MAG: YqaJ viral recombinase family protein [Phycisphaerales bacterium]|nr:YqaJ viral recombinase family protein [Phycisphaerales bacterium]